MAWQIPIANTNAYTSLGTADSLYVSKPIVIGDVSAYGSNQQVLVDGTIASATSGISFDLSGGPIGHNNSVVVYSSGVVRGFSESSAGIATQHYQTTITNHGYVFGGQFGILFAAKSGTTTSTIVNDGTIEGGQFGIGRYTNSTETLSLTNTGTITGGKFSYGQYDGVPSAVDIIVNKGTMNGAVNLGGGNDRLDTSAGRINGIIDGGDGDDTIIGSAYADTILGGKGNDIIKGGGGNDLITGGAGLDHLWGGTGADTFVFKVTTESPATANRDMIEDFSAAQGDRIDIRAIDADTTVAGNQAFHFIGTGAFTNHAGELRYEAAGTSVIVSGDINGDGKADFSVELAHLTIASASWFYL